MSVQYATISMADQGSVRSRIAILEGDERTKQIIFLHTKPEIPLPANLI